MKNGKVIRVFYTMCPMLNAYYRLVFEITYPRHWVPEQKKGEEAIAKTFNFHHLIL